MPRKAKVGYDTIFNTLKKLMVFTENGDLKKQKDPVWSEACKSMPEMNQKNLYIFVHQDRRDIRTNLLKHFNILPAKPIIKGGKSIKKEVFPKYNEVWDDYNYYDQLDDECDNFESELDTLISMKRTKEYKDVINKIGVYPFTIYYWDPDQVELWTELIKIESTVSLIVFDQVVANIKDNFETSNIFVYALAVRIENTTVLLAQMMCDLMPHNEVNYFFTNWLQCNAPPPPELIVSYSHNLLTAASLAFNYCTFDEYNLRCYKYLLNETFNLPATLIKVELIGLIKVIDGWPSFENIMQEVKDFYLCSVMYLSIVDNLEEFKEAVITILAICQNPFENLETETRKESLWSHLTADIIQEFNQQFIHFVSGKYGTKSYSFLNITQNLDFNNSPQEIYEFINQLKLQALEICDFSINTEKTPNNYYCPVILENLINLFSEFPAWTNLVNKNCSNLVSYCTTEHLASLKELREPMKPTKFVNYHLDKIKSTVQKVKRFVKKPVGHKVLLDSLKKPVVIPPQVYEANGIAPVEEHDPHQIYEANDIAPIEEHDPLVFEDDSVNSMITEQTEVDVLDFKNTVLSTMESIMNFDEYLQNTLKKQMKAGQEDALAKALFDCCTEIKSYEVFCKKIVKKCFAISKAFGDSFRQLFVECYHTVSVLNKHELKNVSKLFAHLIMTDCISWDVLSILMLTEKDTDVSKRTFIKVLLKELVEFMGESKLIRKFEEKKYKSAVTGLFPVVGSTEAKYACTFYEAVGLQKFADYLIIGKAGEQSSKLKRSYSNSSVDSTSSNGDFVIEVRVSKKRGKSENDSTFEKKKIVVIK